MAADTYNIYVQCHIKFMLKLLYCKTVIEIYCIQILWDSKILRMESSGKFYILPLYVDAVKDQSLLRVIRICIQRPLVGMYLLHIKASRDMMKSSLERYVETESC